MTFYAGAPQRCRQGWQSARNPPLQRLVRPPNPRAEFRICSCGGCSSRPPFDARRCCTLAGRHSGGRYASTDRVCQNSPRSLFSRHLRSLKKNNAAAPRDPSHTPMEWDGWLRVPNARVYRWSGLTPSRHAAPRTGAAVHAQTAVFGVRRRTRGMVCASHCAQSVAVVGRQRVGRERTTSPFTARGGAPHAALTTTWLATHCEFGFARTPPSVGRNGGAGPTADPGEGRGASPPALPGRARARRRYVGCGLSSHRTHACIGRIPLRFYSSAFAASTDGA